MSGHSKWANIRVKKTAQDFKRGKVFTKHAKLIEIAARAGGGNPETNSTLRTAIDNARAENVPNANMERAIKKGIGAWDGSSMEEVLYACYAPGSVACLIECLTNNRNRTIANLRALIEKHGGKWADTGSVIFLFERRGVVVGRQPHPFVGADFDKQQLSLIDLGAEDIAIDDGMMTVTTNLTDWMKVRDYLREADIEILEAGLKYVPRQCMNAPSALIVQKIAEFVDVLEEDEDVSEVFTNVI